MEIIERPDVVIRSISVSEMDNNVYLITSKSTGQQVLIDAADNPEAIVELVQAGTSDGPTHPQARADGSSVSSVLTTHRHWDHIRALPEVVKHFAAKTAAGADDAEAITSDSGVAIDIGLEHGDRGEFEGFVLRAIALRGHTPGSIAFALKDEAGAVIFSGDSLFPGGPGKTTNPQDFRSLMSDLQSRIFDQYDDATLILPGHGKSTTLGAERPHIPQWLERGW